MKNALISKCYFSFSFLTLKKKLIERSTNKSGQFIELARKGLKRIYAYFSCS